MKYRSKKSIKVFNFKFIKRKNIIWMLFFSLLSLHVFFAVQTSSMGAKIVLYEKKIQILETENTDLSMDLISLTSLTKLNQFSEEMGYKKIYNIFYIQPEDSFAKAW